MMVLTLSCIWTSFKDKKMSLIGINLFIPEYLIPHFVSLTYLWQIFRGKKIVRCMAPGLLLLQRLYLILLAASLRSTESIISPTMTFFGQDLSSNDLDEVEINKYTVCLGIGPEHPQNLKMILQRL